jgi:hypothetical protein
LAEQTQIRQSSRRAAFAPSSALAWRDIEALFVACGADISEGQGSRVRVALNGVRAVFHRPHPQKETDKGAVRSVRRFPSEAGITP